jgi:hypothetical protein
VDGGAFNLKLGKLRQLGKKFIFNLSSPAPPPPRSSASTTPRHNYKSNVDEYHNGSAHRGGYTHTRIEELKEWLVRVTSR